MSPVKNSPVTGAGLLSFHYCFYVLNSYFLCCVFTAGDDELEPADVDWEHLLAATFDPADAMFLGPDEMFSLNRNDVLYAQKYAAARTSSVPPPAPASDHALNDDDLERCANDLDLFVNDLERACANIGQRGAETGVTDDVKAEQSISNTNGRDSDPDIDSNQDHGDDLGLDEGHGKSRPPTNTDEDVGCCAADSVDDGPTKNCLQNSCSDLDGRQDCAEEDGRVLAGRDLDPDDLEVNNGPEIALCELTNDLAAVHRYPYDPDPEATVV